MANHKSALKRIKQNEARNERNRHHRSTLKTFIKRVREAVESNNSEAAKTALSLAIPVIDKAATKGVIHRSNASRNISRLTRLVNTIG